MPEELDVIRDGMDYLLAGGTMSSLAKKMRAEGIPTATGKGVWTNKKVIDLMLSERLDRVELIGPKAAAVRHLLGTRKVSTTHSTVFTRWLSKTVLQCGICGTGLIGAGGAGGRTSYVCAKATGGCGGVAVDALRAEALFTGFIKQVVDVGTAPEEGYAMLLAERAEIEQTLAEIADARYVTKDLDDVNFQRIKRKQEARHDRIDEDLLSQSANAAMAGSLAVWDTLTPNQRRTVAVDRVGPVRVLKGCGDGRWHPERFEPVRPQVALWWKGYLAAGTPAEPKALEVGTIPLPVVAP